MSDPRVFFAAERTLLAWVRSGLTVMALGFVVARFGLFLTLLAASSAAVPGHHPHWVSSTLGIVLVALGAGSILELPAGDLPRLSIPWLSSFLAVSVAVVGLLLALYLALT
jgi:putative membrane protein